MVMRQSGGRETPALWPDRILAGLRLLADGGGGASPPAMAPPGD